MSAGERITELAARITRNSPDAVSASLRALHAAFDGGRLSRADQRKTNWGDDTKIEALSATPLDVSQPETWLKLADKISNLRSIAASPPKGWDHARRLEYVGWAGRVAAGAKGANPALDALFDATYRDAVQRLASEG